MLSCLARTADFEILKNNEMDPVAATVTTLEEVPATNHRAVVDIRNILVEPLLNEAEDPDDVKPEAEHSAADRAAANAAMQDAEEEKSRLERGFGT